jgi:hypothetical protein
MCLWSSSSDKAGESVDKELMALSIDISLAKPAAEVLPRGLQPGLAKQR